MTMFGLSLCLYMTIIVCLRFDVRGELTVDVAYSLLSSRLEHLELETFSIKTSIDDRIDQIETLIKSQLTTNTDVIEVSEGRNENVELEQMNQAKETILNAFASEKLFMRNALTEYEEQFTELRKTVNDQMNVMTKSIEASNESVTNMNTALNQFKSNSDIELQEVIIEFETAMNNTATEHETTVSKVNDVRNSVKNIENDLSSQSSRISAVDNRLSSLYTRAISRIRKASNEVTVAFFTVLGAHIDNPGVNQTVVFDKVVTNIGNGYNPHAGDFRAPVSGVYVFSTTLMAGDHSANYRFQIMRKGTSVANFYIRNGGTASKEAVLHLNKGEDVAIHNLDTGNRLWGNWFSSFSGFLLQEDDPEVGLVGK